MKLPTATILASVATLASSNAAIALFAGYKLGETGSLGANNSPLDYSGNGRNIPNPISGSAATVGTSGAYSGSTHHLSTAGTGNEGWYGPNVSGTLPADNFGFSVWVQAATNTAATQGDAFTLGGGTGAFKLSLAPNGWAASSHGVAWIGGNDGVTGTFAANTWTHLMMIRYNGTTTFYINDVARGATYGGAPTHGDFHMSVNPGGSVYFDGLLDEARVVTFAGSDSVADIRAALIPEPSAALLGGLGLLALLRRRRA